MTFVSLFMKSPVFFMGYIIHLYLVLINCTQVHLQRTWVVPKYIPQNPVLVLVIEHF